jgi:hypothetical protein
VRVYVNDTRPAGERNGRILGSVGETRVAIPDDRALAPLRLDDDVADLRARAVYHFREWLKRRRAALAGGL